MASLAQGLLSWPTLPAEGGSGKNGAASGPVAGILNRVQISLSIIILQTLCQAIFGVVTVNGCPGEAEWFRLASGLKGKWAGCIQNSQAVSHVGRRGEAIKLGPNFTGPSLREAGIAGGQGFFISEGNSAREIQCPVLKRAWPRYVGRPGMKTSPPTIGAIRPPKTGDCRGMITFV